MSSDLSNMGSVKYYKGFLNHAYSLHTINAQRGSDLTFRVSDEREFQFNNISSGQTSNLLSLNKNSASFNTDMVANCPVNFHDSLTVLGTTTLNGSTTVLNDLTVIGSASITARDIDVTGTLDAGDITTGTLTVTEDVTVRGDVVVEGATTATQLDISGDLTVEGLFTANSDVTIAGSLNVTNSVTLADTLTVNSTITCDDTIYSEMLSVERDIWIGGILNVEDVAVIQNCNSHAVFCHYNVKNNSLSDFALYQNSSGSTFIGAPTGNSVAIKDNLVIGDNEVFVNTLLTVDNSIEVTGHTTLNTLNVTGESTFSSTVTFSSVSSLTVDGIANFASDVTMNCNLDCTSIISGGLNTGTANVTGTTSTDTLNVNGNAYIAIAQIDQLSVATTVSVKSLVVDTIATFNSSVTVGGALTVDGETTFSSNIQLDGDLSIASDCNLFLNSGSAIHLHGPVSGGLVQTRDDFTIRNSDNVFKIELSHIVEDTIHYQENCTLITKSGIDFQENSISLYATNQIALVANCVNITGELSVQNNVKIDGTLSVNGDLIVQYGDQSLKMSTTDDYVQLAASGYYTDTGYMMRQNSNGSVILNADTDKSISFKSAGGEDLLVIDSNNVTAKKPVIMDQTLNVTGQATFQSDVTVNGNMTFTQSETRVSGNFDVTGNLNAGHATFRNGLDVDGNLDCGSISGTSFSASTANLGSLTTSGTAQVNGNLTVTDTTSTDELNVTNDITFGEKFSITKENQSLVLKSDTRTQSIKMNNASTVIEDETSVVFKVGSSDKMRVEDGSVTIYNSLNVTGNIECNTISASTGKFGNLEITDVYIKNQSSDVKGFEQSNGTVTVGGADNISLKINDEEKMQIRNTGVTITNELTVENNVNVTNGVTIGGKLDVTGATTMNGGVTVSNGLTVTSGPTSITGDATIDGLCTMNGDAVVNQNLTVSGDVYLNGDLRVVGSTTVVEVESTNVNFEDNILVLAHNCNNAGNFDVDFEAGFYINNSQTAFLYKNVTGQNPSQSWITKGADLGVAKDHILFFNAKSDLNGYKQGWSMELATDSTGDRGENDQEEPDLVFKYYDGNSDNGVIKLRIAGGDDDFDDDI